MSFTPGPWLVEEKYPDEVYDSDGLLIAATHGGSERWEEGCANARLIAAAPDLLEAAKAVRAWMDAAATRGAKTPMQAHELRVLVKNAIEKVEGRS